MRVLSEADSTRLKKNIIKKLYSNKAFNKGHLLFERLQTGIPSHLKGFVKDVLDKLISEGLIQFYGKTKYGRAYQLNIRKLKEIEELIFS